MAKKMLIDATHPEETRVVVADGNKVDDFDFESAAKKQIAGNIYLAKVTRVEPSLQAAFVEYGGNRHGFLAFSEIHPDYYQIPRADREALMAEEEAEARRRAAAEESGRGKRKGRGSRRAASEETEVEDDDQDLDADQDADEDRDEDIDGDDDSMTVVDVNDDDDDSDAGDDDGSDDDAGAASDEADAPRAQADRVSADADAAEPEIATASAAPTPEAEAAPAPAAAGTPEPEAEAQPAPADPDIEEVDPEAKPPSSIAESAGTGDDDRVEEDYVPAPAAERRPEDETAATAESEAAAAPVLETTTAASATVEDAAEPEATTEAEAEVAAPETEAQAETPAESGPAAEAEADAPAAPAAETTETTETAAAEADAPVDAPSETDEAAASANPAAGDAEAPVEAPETAAAAEAEAKAAEGDVDAAAQADAAEAESSESEGEGEEDGDRRRRRSRRGGRSRRSRRGRARAEDGTDAEADPEADSPEPARPSRSRPSRSRDAAPDDDDDAPAPAAEPAGRDSDGGDDMAEAISARRIFQRRYKIQEVIKVRQILLVQVVKEERGNKGAALTTYLSLAGRYCVLMPNTARGGGISRKITNAADRKKLKDIASEFEVPKGMGLIIRTAGAKRTRAEIERDYEYLLRQWEQVRSITLKSVAPSLIYEEGSLIKRVIRDLYATGIDQIVVEGAEGWREARDYMGMLMPGHARNVVLHEGGAPLFAKHGVEQELSALIHPVVQLKSGGYIVIGVTEALVAIDINSGKSTKEGSIEDTALKTNLEAADEIARQLRLRDLAGLIVIDFIDMEDPRNNRAVEKRMKEKLKIDRARIQVGRISAFGLMEMSRQRLRPGVLEATTAPCAHCHGTGIVRADSSLALAILRQLEGEAARARAPELLVHAPMGAAAYLLNDKRENLSAIEAQHGVVVRVQPDPALFSPEFHIEKVKTQTRKPTQVAAVTALSVAPPDLEDYDQIEEAEVVETEAPEPEATPEPEAARPPRARADAADDGDDDDASRRRRGRRGGRRRRRGPRDEDGGAEADSDVAADADAADAPSTPDDATDAGTETGETAETDAEPVDAAIPAPRRTRRRRKPRAEAAETSTEAPAPIPAAAASEAVTDMAAETAPEADASGDDEAAAAVSPAMEAPLEEPAPEAPEEPAQPDATTAESAPEAVATDAEDSAPAPASMSEERAEAEPALQTAEAPASVETAQGPDSAPADDTRPKKRGWWAFNR